MDKETIKNDILLRQISMSKVGTSTNKVASVIMTLEQGGRLKSDLSRSHLYSDQSHLY